MEATTKVHIATAVTERLDAIRRLAIEYGVERLEVYGDAAETELENSETSVHLLVTYPEGYDYGPWLERYAELLAALSTLLDRRVHLTMSGAIDNAPHRREWIEATRRLIYAAT